jgi:hypothetical protein
VQLLHEFREAVSAENYLSAESKDESQSTSHTLSRSFFQWLCSTDLKYGPYVKYEGDLDAVAVKGNEFLFS